MGTINRAPTVTIANGATVSNGVALLDQQVVGVITPAVLTGTSFTFQGSIDGVTYVAVTKEDGTAYTITVAASKYVMIPPAALGGLNYLKVVSSGAEGGARNIILVLRTIQ